MKDETEENLDYMEQDLEEEPQGNPGIIKSILAIQVPVLVIALLWGFFRKIDWWHAFRFDGTAVWGLLLGLALPAVNQISYRVFRKLPFTHMDWMFDNLFYPLCREITVPQLLALSAISGFCEEALFRGVIQREWGIIICNIIFGVLHTGDRRLIFMGLWSAVMGVVLSYSYALTGNLLVPMTAHGLNNLCGLAFFRYVYRPSGLTRQ